MTNQQAKKIIENAISSGKKSLLEPEALEILRAWGISVPEYAVVKDLDEAKAVAQKIGYPVALKVISRDIVHKTEAGGVALGLKNEQDMEDSFNSMIYELSEHYPTGVIEGFLIEKMAEKGVEVIIGGVRDEQFGPAVMFGLGGVMVELLKDVSFRLAPLDKDEALKMMKEVKAYPLLTGFRGTEPLDIKSIAGMLVKISEIMQSIDGIKEMEINPLIVYAKGVMAVDARVVLGSH